MTQPGSRVLIVDDHRLFSEVIRSTLESMGMEVLGAATTGSEGLDVARRERPDVVLVDIGLPDESGLAVGKKILEEMPETKLVAVTSLIDPRAVAEAVRLGFRGYVTKDTPVNQFVSSIRAVLDGNVIMPKQLAKAAAGDRSPEEQHAAMLVKQLTDRERQVLQLLAEGSSGVQIAARLSISPNTVRTHVQSILTKLQVHSRLEAAAFAVRHGLIRTPGERRPN
ncbi:MAG TPA: response regulator transcription factor [Actinomycetota bacterium]